MLIVLNLRNDCCHSLLAVTQFLHRLLMTHTPDFRWQSSTWLLSTWLLLQAQKPKAHTPVSSSLEHLSSVCSAPLPLFCHTLPWCKPPKCEPASCSAQRKGSSCLSSPWYFSPGHAAWLFLIKHLTSKMPLPLVSSVLCCCSASGFSPVPPLMLHDRLFCLFHTRKEQRQTKKNVDLIKLIKGWYTVYSRPSLWRKPVLHFRRCCLTGIQQLEGFMQISIYIAEKLRTTSFPSKDWICQ